MFYKKWDLIKFTYSCKLLILMIVFSLVIFPSSYNVDRQILIPVYVSLLLLLLLLCLLSSRQKMMWRCVGTNGIGRRTILVCLELGIQVVSLIHVSLDNLTLSCQILVLIFLCFICIRVVQEMLNEAYLCNLLRFFIARFLEAEKH